MIGTNGYPIKCLSASHRITCRLKLRGFFTNIRTVIVLLGRLALGPDGISIVLWHATEAHTDAFIGWMMIRKLCAAHSTNTTIFPLAASRLTFFVSNFRHLKGDIHSIQHISDLKYCSISYLESFNELRICEHFEIKAGTRFVCADFEGIS